MKDENFSIVKSLGITRENGYIPFNSNVDDLADTPHMEVVSSTEQYLVHKLVAFDVYLVRPMHGYHTAYRKIDTDEDAVREHVKSLTKKGPFFYYKYNIKGLCETGKKITSSIRVKPEYELKIKNIIKKMDLHRNISINILLHGPPGTGKSSFVEYLAQTFRSNVYVPPPFENGCNISTVFNVISARERCIVLLPEIDKMLNEHGEPVHSSNELYELLDGMNRPTNSIIVMTCNDPDRIKRNSILSRPGRINMELKFDLADEEDIKFIIHKYYPKYDNFDKFRGYYNKVSHAEIENAICQHYIMDEPLDSFKITMKTSEHKKTNMYY
jgi:hypothetical protein